MRISLHIFPDIASGTAKEHTLCVKYISTLQHAALVRVLTDQFQSLLFDPNWHVLISNYLVKESPYGET